MGLYLGTQRVGNLGETFTPREIQSVNGKYSVDGNITVYGVDTKLSAGTDINISQKLSSLESSIPHSVSQLANDVPYLSASQMSEYWKKSETSSKVELDLEFPKHLMSSDISFSYSSTTKKLTLVAGAKTEQVDCADFIKDGMLSSVELCGNTLVFTFNTDAGTTPISVNLSSFIDNYGEQITYLSGQISLAQESIAATNASLASESAARASGDEILSGAISSISDYLSNFYLTTETSSASEISIALNVLSDYTQLTTTNELSTFLSNAIQNKVKIGNYASNSYDLSSSDLSVVKITADDYYRLISEEKDLSNVLYVVSSDNLNAHEQRIIDVAEPELSNDAATKNYVDSNLQNYYNKIEISAIISSIVEAYLGNLENQLKQI